MSTTLTINLTGIAGGLAPGTSVRIDLNNCSNPRVVGTGQIVPQSQTFFPTAGIVICTLFDNTQITCGRINVQNSCGCPDVERTSYYSINFVYQGQITSLGSYNLKPGSFNLWDLTPCIGDECICGNAPAQVAIYDQVPVGVIDGVNDTFLLTFAPKSLWLSLNGVYQSPGVDYTLNQNVITFIQPPLGGALNAKYVYGACTPLFFAETPGGAVNGSNVTFTLTNSPVPKSLFLYAGGVYQTLGNDYSLAGNIITFFFPPVTDTVLYAEYVYGVGATYETITTQTPAGLVNGVNTIFTLTTIPSFLQLYKSGGFGSGQLLIPGADYSLSGRTITTTTPPGGGTVLYATIYT